MVSGNPGNLLHTGEDRQRGEGRQRTDFDELQSMSVDKRSSEVYLECYCSVIT